MLKQPDRFLGKSLILRKFWGTVVKDQELLCVQCENIFVVTADEKRRLIERGFDIPKRCPDCRKRKHRYFEEEDEEWGQNRKKRYPRRERIYFRERE